MRGASSDPPPLPAPLLASPGRTSARGFRTDPAEQRCIAQRADRPAGRPGRQARHPGHGQPGGAAALHPGQRPRQRRPEPQRMVGAGATRPQQRRPATVVAGERRHYRLSGQPLPAGRQRRLDSPRVQRGTTLRRNPRLRLPAHAVQAAGNRGAAADPVLPQLRSGGQLVPAEGLATG
ncbi:hypothetical protein D3C84_523950 [compost metagenome]